MVLLDRAVGPVVSLAPQYPQCQAPSAAKRQLRARHTEVRG